MKSEVFPPSREDSENKTELTPFREDSEKFWSPCESKGKQYAALAADSRDGKEKK